MKNSFRGQRFAVMFVLLGISFAGAVSVYASTTIGADINTGGNLTVTGTGTLGTSTVTNLISSNTSTSTFAGGISLSSGCLSIGGACLGSGGGGSGTVGSGSAGWFPYYGASGTILTATSSLSINTNTGLILVGPTTANLFAQQGGSAGSTQIDQTIRNSGTNNNVATFQQMSADGFSAIRFADNNGVEHIAIGYGNSSAGAPFGGNNFIETSVPTGGQGAIPPLYFITTSIDATRVVHAMMSGAGAGGFIFAGCDLTSVTACTGSGGAPIPEAPLDVFGPAVFSMPSVANNSRSTVAAGNFPLNVIQTSGSAGLLRLVRDTVVKVDFQINGSGSTRRLDLVDTDNSSVVPLTVTLNGTGRVGIGTTTPQSKLQVTAGASATTTVTIGELGLTSSKGCVNMNAADGSASSFYINAAHQMVVEANYCR